MKTYGTELNVDQDLGIMTNTQRQQPRGMERETLGPAPLVSGGWFASGWGKPTTGGQASLVVQLVKNLPAMAGDPGSIRGSGRSPGEGIGYQLQYSWASLG